MIAALLLAGCSPAAPPQPAPAPRPAMRTVPGLTVAIEAAPARDRIGLAFLVTADTARTVSVWEPTLPEDLRAFVDGREVTVVRPPLDLPARQRAYPIDAGRSVRIPCPVVLRFGGEPIDDGLLWTIPLEPAPETVAIEAGLRIDDQIVDAPRIEIPMR